MGIVITESSECWVPWPMENFGLHTLLIDTTREEAMFESKSSRGTLDGEATTVL